MSQGMCLFDAEQRVVFANRRFAEIYDLDPEQVKPGTTLRQHPGGACRKGCLQQHRHQQVRRRGRCQLRPGDLADRAPRGRTLHLRPAPADAGWRPGQHPRGRHRAREAQWPRARAARGEAAPAERAARRRPEQHGPGPRHVRCRAARRAGKQSLCGDLRAHSRAGEPRHANARDLRGSHRQWLLLRQDRRADAEDDAVTHVRPGRHPVRLAADRRPPDCGIGAARWPTAASSRRIRISPTSAARRPRSCTWRCTMR